jgi:hypothetical protein
MTLGTHASQRAVLAVDEIMPKENLSAFIRLTPRGTLGSVRTQGGGRQR